MTMIINESFQTGIPANFATMYDAQNNPDCFSYNSQFQSVDINNIRSVQNIWAITSSQFMPKGEFETDVEVLADNSGTGAKHFGLWLSPNSTTRSSGLRFFHYVDYWSMSRWSDTSEWSETNNNLTKKAPDTATPANIGNRMRMGAKWDFTNPSKTPILELKVNDISLLLETRNFDMSQIRMGIFTYATSLRVRNVKLWDEPVIPFDHYGFNGTPGVIGRLDKNAANPSLLSRHGLMNKLGRAGPFNGTGNVRGVVQERIPPDIFVHRRVCLIDEKTRTLFRETWSDPVTGYYAFDGLELGRPYSIIAYDYTDDFSAVILNGHFAKPTIY